MNLEREAAASVLAWDATAAVGKVVSLSAHDSCVVQEVPDEGECGRDGGIFMLARQKCYGTVGQWRPRPGKVNARYHVSTLKWAMNTMIFFMRRTILYSFIKIVSHQANVLSLDNPSITFNFFIDLTTLPYLCWNLYLSSIKSKIVTACQQGLWYEIGH